MISEPLEKGLAEDIEGTKLLFFNFLLRKCIHISVSIF